MEPERKSGARTTSQETSRRWPKWFAGIAGGALFFLGAVAIPGRTFDLNVLKSGFPGLPPMVPNTAAGFLLAEDDIPPRVDRALGIPAKLRDLRQAFADCAQLYSSQNPA